MTIYYKSSDQGKIDQNENEKNEKNENISCISSWKCAAIVA